MTISGGSALPKEEIERMVREAELHAEEDRKRREEAEARNQAEQLAWSTEKFLKDNEDKVPADTRTEVEQSIADVRKALSENASVEELKAKTEALATTSQKIGQAMYAAEQAAGAGAEGASQGAPQGGAQAGSSTDDDVVDAEVVDDEGDARGRSA